MDAAKRRQTLIKYFTSLDEDLKSFFGEFLNLVNSKKSDAGSKLSLDIVLAYSFFKLEQGQLQALHCGARKLYQTSSDLTWNALDNQLMTLDSFHDFFEKIYSFKVPDDIKKMIGKAKKTRNKVMHGKAGSVKDIDKLEAVSNVLHYCDRLNSIISAHANLNFKPFKNDLRGITGAAKPLDGATSRWILKGIGFSLK